MCTRSLVLMSALVVVMAAAPVHAADPLDKAALDSVVKDLGLTLFTKPDDSSLKLPLSPGGWSLFGRMTPYASMGSRIFSPGIEDVTGLAAPMRDPRDELSKGLGFGAGLNWHLSDWFEVFGEYQLFTLRGRGAQTDSTGGRRELEAPTLKGGFSIRF